MHGRFLSPFLRNVCARTIPQELGAVKLFGYSRAIHFDTATQRATASYFMFNKCYQDMCPAHLLMSVCPNMGQFCKFGRVM